ncbi:hypothetical protein H3C61_03320 [Candidatus Gracilibacteria bacterium]|nr:hypothetical protein [Candidatus Gracilibacteria bacterium]
MKNIKYILQFLAKNFLTGFIIMLGGIAALLGVQAFQGLSTNPNDTGNQSLSSPILTTVGGVFNRNTQSLEAIAKFLGIGGATGTKRVFLTKATYNGNLGGVAGADAKCQSVANGASLGGNWKAFISDSTSNFVDRYTLDNTKYLYTNLGGQPIFTSGLPGFYQVSNRKNAGDFLTYNNLTYEDKSIVSSTAMYWSNNETSGKNYSSSNCTNWTLASGGAGYYGYLNYTGIDAVGNPANLYMFYYYSTYNCRTTAPLLCVEN